jgi:hypothetical protein
MNTAVAGLRVSDHMHGEQRLAHIRRLAWGMYAMATPPPTSPAAGTSSAATTAKCPSCGHAVTVTVTLS